MADRQSQAKSRTLAYLAFHLDSALVFFDDAIGKRQTQASSLAHNTGYRGRLGIYEVLVPDEKMRHLIASGASILEMTQMARQIGATPMLEDAREKVNAGLTTLEEVLRVLGPQ